MTARRTWALAIYRWALFAFPRGFRDRHAQEMEDLFVHLHTERLRRGVPSTVVFWARVVRDTTTHAVSERLVRRRRDLRQPTEHKSRKLMSNLMFDLRFAVRTLVKAPLFTFVAVVTLALGLGANTAIFSVVNSVLLSPLPYPQPESIVWVDEWQDSRSRSLPVAWLNFRDWREQSRSFVGLAAFQGGSATVLGSDRPLRATVAGVSQDFWEVFPVQPVVGRLTVAGDHVEGAPDVVVLREDYWRTELSGQDLARIVLEIGGKRHQAVGVVPSELDFPYGAQLWIPAFPSASSRTAHNWRVVGRLATGVSIARADEELDAITVRVVATEPADPDFLAEGVRILPLREQVAGSARQPLFLLLGAAGLVLLVACTNLASTLMARGETRHREMAIRSSMGASRGRLIVQLVIESLVLSTLGGGAGLALAAGLIRFLRGLDSVAVPRLGEISVDPAVLLFTGAVVLITALAFGLLPALRLSGVDVTPALKEGARGGSHDGRSRVWTLLVGSEVALAFVLLVGSGLLIRSFSRLMAVDRGFVTEGVLTADIDLSLLKYASAADHAQFYNALETALEAEPEISAAGLVSVLPLSGLPNGRLDLDGDLSKSTVAGYVLATPGYFDVLGIRLIRGRLFDGRDGPNDAHVVVVSESFAENAWPGENPIGHQVSGGGMDALWEERLFATVVGVVSDLHYRSLAREPDAVAYFPPLQRPSRLRYESNIVVRAADGNAGGATAALRRTLNRADPDVPPRFQTMESRVSRSLDERRFMLYVLGGFALVALILAAVGIYGVVSYSVARRTREIGIRLALGAEPATVRRQVQSHAMTMVGIGVAVGIVASAIAGRLLTSFLFGVSSADPLTLSAVAAVLLITAWLGVAVPARRSTRVDPLTTMRAD